MASDYVVVRWTCGHEMRLFLEGGDDRVELQNGPCQACDRVTLVYSCGHTATCPRGQYTADRNVLAYPCPDCERGKPAPRNAERRTFDEYTAAEIEFTR